MNAKPSLILLTAIALLVGCAAPATPTAPPARPTAAVASPEILFPLTLTPGAVTPLPGMTVTSAPNTSGICADPQAAALIETFKTAVLNSDGLLLSSLISPQRHMDVGFFREGTVLTYTPEHAKFLFETTFEVEWGVEPGSGALKKGPFHEVVVPELVKIFSQPYTLHCNELKHGGATYELNWPYEGDFYSVYFPGTQANGNMDWLTWAVGMEYVNNKPYIYALLRFFWEP